MKTLIQEVQDCIDYIKQHGYTVKFKEKEPVYPSITVGYNNRLKKSICISVEEKAHRELASIIVYKTDTTEHIHKYLTEKIEYIELLKASNSLTKINPELLKLKF